MAGNDHLVSSAFLLFLLLASSLTFGNIHNITAILSGFPDYSLYNSYLSQTKLADEINSGGPLTVLVLPNSATAAFASRRPLAALKRALRLLSLLAYIAPPNLLSLPSASTLLLNTSVNISAAPGGKISFSGAFYSRSVTQVPYNLSVLEISAPIVFPGLLDTPINPISNLTAVLIGAGCKRFADLVSSSGVIEIFESAMPKGFTLFVPTEGAFQATGIPDLGSLSRDNLIAVIKYHAVADYFPKPSLKMMAAPIVTMASTAARKCWLGVVSRGEDLMLDTGVNTSRVAGTLLDETPVCVLTVDIVLLPVELLGKTAPAPAPGPAGKLPGLAPAPEKAKEPSPMVLSPEMKSLANSPAENWKVADLKSGVAEMVAGTVARVVPVLLAVGSVL